MYYARRAAGVAAIAALAAGAWYSVVLARADAWFRQGTPEAVARALELAPRNPAYLSLRALQIEYDGADPRPLLERWAMLNPLSSAPRLRLGLDAEVRGDFASAQRWLLEAARVDRQFEPAWTLANFYFRQQKTGEFWTWMRAALQVSYGDRRPAFDLCWQTAGDAREILARAIPERREVVAAFLAYLIDGRHPETAPVAVKLARWRDPADLPLLYRACDALLEVGRTGEALEVWTALGHAPPHGIVSPDFDAPRLGHGFDWRLLPSGGITHLALDSPPAHRILFSGREPESCELLRQHVLLRAGRRYRLRWEARTAGFPARTGLEWSISGQHGNLHANLAASNDWSAQESEFAAPAVAAVLSLEYRRPPGEARAEGSLDLRHVTLEEAPR